jgi:RHS repeat-associated protein
VRVERFDPAGAPVPSSDVVYTIVRDELGSVVGLLDEAAVADPAQPALLARYHYTPYGEAHAETGPELLEAHFDESLISLELPAGPVEQSLAGDAAPGGVRVRLTLPADAATLAAGVVLERFDPVLGWVPLGPAELVLAPNPVRPEELVLLPLAGWLPGATYRLRLTSQLTDLLDRPLVQADAFSWTIPASEPGEPPQPASFRVRRSPTYDSATAAWSTLDGAFPGGQNLLFHGLWHDPVTGFGYARARWYDPRNASWLSEDNLGDIDSPNLYAYVAWQPHMATDPMGTCVLGLPCPAPLKSIGRAFGSAATGMVEGVRQWGEPGGQIIGEAGAQVHDLPVNFRRTFDPTRTTAERRESSWEVAKGLAVVAPFAGVRLPRFSRLPLSGAPALEVGPASEVIAAEVSGVTSSVPKLSQGAANNVKGWVFENVSESASRRMGQFPFFRTARRGGMDFGLLEDQTVILREAKFANRLQYDDFTAITRNLRSNIEEIRASLGAATDLARADKDLIARTLDEALAGRTPGNLRIEVQTGKAAVGLRLQARIRANTGGIPVEFTELP